MKWVTILTIGFVLNFMVGFGIKGFLFREFRPSGRAAATAFISWMICAGGAFIGGYFFGGLAIAFTMLLIAISWHILPALAHFAVLYFQMSAAWSYTDEDQAADDAILQAENAKYAKGVAHISEN